MPEGLINRTFENFEVGWQDKTLKVCRKYAEGFKLEAAMGYRSLILYSPSPGWANAPGSSDCQLCHRPLGR